MNGIINVHKEPGCTSQHVVSAIRKIFSTKAVGHMGTLDPQGEGVLPVGIGKATRLFDLLLSKDKVYEAVFKFGYETDTLDKDGIIVKTSDVLPTENQIIEAARKFIGKINQVPPRYSAKNINGVRAYDLARRGKEVNLQPASVEIFDFTLLRQVGEDEYLFRICCSSGTYIRSLCRDIAAQLGTAATMTAIKRTRSGRFSIDDAKTLDQISEMGESAIIPVENVLADMPREDFPVKMYKQILCGVSFPFVSKYDLFTVYCNGEFFGVGTTTPEGMFRIKTYLKD